MQNEDRQQGAQTRSAHAPRAHSRRLRKNRQRSRCANGATQDQGLLSLKWGHLDTFPELIVDPAPRLGVQSRRTSACRIVSLRPLLAVQRHTLWRSRRPLPTFAVTRDRPLRGIGNSQWHYESRHCRGVAAASEALPCMEHERTPRVSFVYRFGCQSVTPARQNTNAAMSASSASRIDLVVPMP
jgi:hypothetical protein